MCRHKRASKTEKEREICCRKDSTGESEEDIEQEKRSDRVREK